MRAAIYAALLVLLAAPAGAVVVDVVCPDGTRYIGTGQPPCAIRCAFGGWVMPGEECSRPRGIEPTQQAVADENVEPEPVETRWTVAAVFLLILAVVAYFAPTLTAYSRGHHQRQAIFVLNLLLGWTVLGWIACAVWCSTAIRRDVEP